MKRDPLQRLYETRLALLATLLTVTGIALLLVGRLSESTAVLAWLRPLPVTDLGSAVFTSGLVVMLFEHLRDEDADERATARLDKVITNNIPAIRDAVVDGFAFKPEALAEVASPESLDRVIRNCLTIRLGDRELAADVYSDLQHQILGPERRRDMRVVVSLTPWPDGPTSGHGAMFVATVRREYRTSRLPASFRFTCVSDLAAYRKSLLDATSTEAWYFRPVGPINGASPGVFQLLDVRLDGVPLAVRRRRRVDGQSFTVTTPAGTTEAGLVSYTYRALVQQSGHLLYLDFGQPCKGIEVDLHYGGCAIRHVNVLDFIAGSQQPRIQRSPAASPVPSVHIGFDGWIFPRSGVAFAWVLEHELVPTAAADHPDSADRRMASSLT